MDDERSPYWINPAHYETSNNPYNDFIVPTGATGDWSGDTAKFAVWDPTLSTWSFDLYNDVATVPNTSQDTTDSYILPLATGTRFWNYTQFYGSTLVEMPAGLA